MGPNNSKVPISLLNLKDEVREPIYLWDLYTSLPKEGYFEGISSKTGSI